MRIFPVILCLAMSFVSKLAIHTVWGQSDDPQINDGGFTVERYVKSDIPDCFCPKTSVVFEELVIIT